MNYIFYDLETTGRSPQWDQIIQIGAILTNDKFKILDSFDIRCNLRIGHIPYPKALLVNKTTINIIKNTNLSHFNLINIIYKKFSEWSPAYFMGYNSINFDEEFLRNTFFKSLIDPYITIKDGNKRADILSIIRAQSSYFPEVLKTNINAKGNPIYKLDNIAPLNGIKQFSAHDALGDATATLELAKLTHKNNIELWKKSLSSCSKSDANNLIEKDKIFCSTETIYGKIKTFLLAFIGYHPKYKWALCFDLKNEPTEFINMEDETLKTALNKSPKIIRSIKTNKHPIMMSFNYYKKIEEYHSIGEEELLNRFNIINKNQKFKERIIKIIDQNTILDDAAKSQLDMYAEETIYKSFPSSSDKYNMLEFYKSNWKDKLRVLEKFKDERYIYFAHRLIFEESPNSLPNDILKKINRDIASKIFSINNEKWNTLSKAYKEIDDLREKYDNVEEKNTLKELDEISNFIENIEKSFEDA